MESEKSAGETPRQAAVARVIEAARSLAKDQDFMNLQDLVVALQDLDTVPGDVMQVEPAHPGQCCVAKYPGEPTFTLVGRDKLAVETILHWLHLAKCDVEQYPGRKINQAKFLDAADVADRFNNWQKANPDKVKLPD